MGAVLATARNDARMGSAAGARPERAENEGPAPIFAPKRRGSLR